MLPDTLLSNDTRKSLPIALLRAREALMSHFRPMLQNHQITEQQWRVIRILAEYESLEATDLAEKAYILPPSLTRMLKSLEQRKLIHRKKDDDDGRRVILEISEGGKLLMDKVSPDSIAIYEDLEQRYGKKMLDELLDVLDKISAFNINNK